MPERYPPSELRTTLNAAASALGIILKYMVLLPLRPGGSWAIKRFSRHVRAFAPARQARKTRIPIAAIDEVLPQTACQVPVYQQLERKGTTSYIENYYISLICAALRPQRVFEIGTFQGGTTYHIALNTPDDAVIYTLDLKPEQVSVLKYEKKDRLDEEVIHHSSGAKFEGTPLSRKIVRLWGDSATFDFSAFRGQMDLVLVDGSHEYPYARDDTAHALETIKPGGVIIWHDFDIAPGVSYALEKVARERDVYQLRDSSYAIHVAKGK
ncbi:MAG: class I SAM-dependent methyltransferase [Anaerolineae bacterium]|nr:class I SAM-dependent methyltransferase [Anaerolineae bacterium]